MQKKSHIFDFIKGTEPNVNRESVEIIGAQKVIVEDTASVLLYCDDCIRLSTGKTDIIISGDQLRINDYKDKNVIIYGKIKNISFE